MSDLLDSISSDDIKSLKTVGSADIVDAFLKQDKTHCRVNVKATGRDASQVYAALKAYIANHPEKRVVVKRYRKQVILYREAVD